MTFWSYSARAFARFSCAVRSVILSLRIFGRIPRVAGQASKGGFHLPEKPNTVIVFAIAGAANLNLIVQYFKRVSNVFVRHSGHDATLSVFVGKEEMAAGSARVDQGSEFISRDLDLWAYQKGVILDFSRPGKPTDNAFIESFNGKFRQECLNAHWFMSLDDARQKMEEWREDYNNVRPHSAIGNKPPVSLINGSQVALTP